MVTHVYALYVFPYMFLDARTRKNRGTHFSHITTLLTPMTNILKRCPNPNGEGCGRSERLYWASSNQGFIGYSPKPATCCHGGLIGSGSLREKASSIDSALPRKPPGARLLVAEWLLRDLCTGDLSGSPLCSALPLAGGVLCLSADDSSAESSCRGLSPPGNCGT